MSEEQIKVELQEFMGSDRSISEAAWTSSLTLQGKEKRTDEDVHRVVNMLIKDKHASPIEAVVMRFWIKMPIAADRQHMTHRVASHNGASGRYRTMPSEYYRIPQDVELITRVIPQGKKVALLDNSIIYGMDDIFARYYDICESANLAYQQITKLARDAEKKELITNKEFKRIREFYRGMLPQHNMTERITVINLRSFANYQKLRNSEHAQPEIKMVADLMLQEVIKKNVCPIAIEALQKNSWNI